MALQGRQILALAYMGWGCDASLDWIPRRAAVTADLTLTVRGPAPIFSICRNVTSEC